MKRKKDEKRRKKPETKCACGYDVLNESYSLKLINSYI